MLEKYQPDFDEERFLKEMMAEQGLTKAKAMELCRKKIPKEAYYQGKIRKALISRYPDGFIRKIPQGAYSEGGMPDILAIIKGHYFGLEVKRPIVGAPSKMQIETIRRIRRAGGTAEIVRWPEEAAGIIEAYFSEETGHGG